MLKLKSNFFSMLILLASLSTGCASSIAGADVLQNKSCAAPLSDDLIVKVAQKYSDAEGNKVPIQIASIDLNGDEFCDLLVEFQERFPVCASGAQEDCELMKQGQWTDFYLATAQHEYVDKAVTAERDRWTDGGLYVSYRISGHDMPFVVWDLRGHDRHSSLTDSYTVFQWHKGINYLDAQIRIDYSLEQDSAQQVLDFHNSHLAN